MPATDDSDTTSVTREVTRFVVAGLIAASLIAIGTFVVVNRDAEDQAISHATDITALEARGIIQPNLPSALLSATPQQWRESAASSASKDPLAIFDRIVRTRVLNPDVTQNFDIVHVKIWEPDGTIAYSDELALIGQRFVLGDEELTALRTGQANADISDLTKPENRYERNQGKLLEVYLPIKFAGGSLLFETYQKYDAITQYQQAVWSSFLPVLLLGLGVLFLVQIPLAWRLARRVRAGLRERSALLERAITASQRERQRIARDLHDGVVQRLTALKLSSATGAMRLREKDVSPAADTLDATAQSIGNAIQELRTLIVEIAPPNLAIEGLENAIADLLEPLSERGLSTTLRSDPDLGLSAQQTELLYRVAQEALRNVSAHAEATTVGVTVARNDGRVRLDVTDDGRGFDPEEAQRRRAEGHVGLSLLGDIVRDSGGSFTVEAQPGGGTTISAEVPLL